VSGVACWSRSRGKDAIAGRFSAAGTAASTNVGSVPTLLQTIVAVVPQRPIAATAQGDLLALIFFVVVFGTPQPLARTGAGRSWRFSQRSTTSRWS
jgi:hypothetical protein